MAGCKEEGMMSIISTVTVGNIRAVSRINKDKDIPRHAVVKNSNMQEHLGGAFV